MKPLSIPTPLSRTIATGAKQLVVQDPFEIMLCLLVNMWLLTPCTIVASTSEPGADIITFFAPALMWALALSLLAKTPLHSKTTSTLSFFQGSLIGSLSLKNLIFWFL